MLLRYVLRRLLWAIPVVFFVTIVVFSLIHFIPGDPILAMIGSYEAPPAVIEALRAQYNLDKPVVVQYLIWLKTFIRGDLGISVITKEPVLGLILNKLPKTAALAGASILIAVAISLTAGVVAAWKRNTVWDLGITVFTVLGISIPAFWLGIMMILLFALYLGVLPSMGHASFLPNPLLFFRHLLLPALAVGLINAGYLTRVVRSQVVDVLEQDYVRTARAKGLRESIVLSSHALRNALIPIVTAIGMRFAYLMGGTVINEQIFAWPGIGRLVLSSIINRDYPVVQGVVLVSAIIFVIVNLAVDVLYTILDPRVRLD